MLLFLSLFTGCSAAWLAYLHGVQVVGGSNPLIPTIVNYNLGITEFSEDTKVFFCLFVNVVQIKDNMDVFLL